MAGEDGMVAGSAPPPSGSRVELGTRPPGTQGCCSGSSGCCCCGSPPGSCSRCCSNCRPDSHGSSPLAATPCLRRADARCVHTDPSHGRQANRSSTCRRNPPRSAVIPSCGQECPRPAKNRDRCAGFSFFHFHTLAILGTAPQAGVGRAGVHSGVPMAGDWLRWLETAAPT